MVERGVARMRRKRVVLLRVDDSMAEGGNVVLWLRGSVIRGETVESGLERQERDSRNSKLQRDI